MSSQNKPDDANGTVTANNIQSMARHCQSLLEKVKNAGKCYQGTEVVRLTPD